MWSARGALAAVPPVVCALAMPLSLNASDEAVVEEIVVTGSRIPRPDFHSASPIVTIDGTAFERTAATTLEAVLNRYPQFVPDYGASSNNPGIGGKATLQLRGLGAHSTLVLVDGRRLIPATGQGAVDVNVIPPSLIERVEVVSGGASVVYGSDAVAGVVDFRLLDDFDGVQLDGSWGQSARQDGEERSLSVTGGASFLGGRGRLLGHVGYAERDDVLHSDRAQSAYVFEYQGPGLGTTGPGSGYSVAGFSPVAEATLIRQRFDPTTFDTLFAGYGYTPATALYFPGSSGVAVNDDGTVFTTGGRAPDGTPLPPGSVANFRGDADPRLFNDRIYLYNIAPWNYLQLPLERTSVFTYANYTTDKGAELYVQSLYSDYSASTALAPASAFPLFAPRTNPYIPADLGVLLDSRVDPGADLRMAKRFAELGPRSKANDYQLIQTTIGIRGDWLGDWQYDAYLQWGDNDQREIQTGNVLRSRFHELSFAADGGQAICGGFDFFRVGAISAECADYISGRGSNRSGYQQWAAEVSTIGSVFEVPAGMVEVAVGVMRKRDEYFYDADPLAAVILADGFPEVAGFNAADDIDASDHNTDVFIEGRVPLSTDSTGAVVLETLIGYRYTYYDSAGAADAWKAELMYEPLAGIRLRGSVQRAVRAPSIYELYLPRLPWPTFGVADPCAAGSPERSGPAAAAVQELCVSQGVPPAAIADYPGTEFYLGAVGGNPDLDPEIAHTLTAGVVLTPTMADAAGTLQLSVDWFRVEVDDAIEFVRSDTFLPACYDPTTNPTMTTAGYWCGFFGRDPTTGDIDSAVETMVNFSRREVRGVDMHIDWQRQTGPGMLGLTAVVSWLDRFALSGTDGLPTDDRTGLVGGVVGGSQPEWKGTVGTSYQWHSLTIGSDYRFVGAMTDADVDGRADRYRVSSQNYVDLYLAYRFSWSNLDGAVLQIGLENATNERPPLLPSAVQANTDPSQYDTLGRRFYLRGTYRF